MKPDWKDAPEWAQWLAMDSSGLWYWHESEPEWHFETWISDDATVEAGENVRPADSLERRP